MEFGPSPLRLLIEASAGLVPDQPGSILFAERVAESLRHSCSSPEDAYAVLLGRFPVRGESQGLAAEGLSTRQVSTILDGVEFFRFFSDQLALEFDAPNRIIFVHVEKSAGTSVKHSLSHLPDSAFLDVTGRRTANIENGWRAAAVLRACLQIATSSVSRLCLAGHISLSDAVKSRLWQPGATIFASCRDPFELHASNGRYIVQQEARARSSQENGHLEAPIAEVERVLMSREYREQYAEIYLRYFGTDMNIGSAISLVELTRTDLINVDDLSLYMHNFDVHLPRLNESSESRPLGSACESYVAEHLVGRDLALLRLLDPLKWKSGVGNSS